MQYETRTHKIQINTDITSSGSIAVITIINTGLKIPWE